MTVHLRRRSLLLFVVALVALFGGVAWATIPGSDGVILGCYENKTGNLKVVDALPCPKNHTSLPWNQAGVAGTPGTNGTSGTNGTNGVSGWEIVRVQRVAQPSTDLSWTVFCSAGKKVLGGGVTKQIIGNSEVTESGPADDGLGWTSGIDNLADFPEPVTFYAICATV